jgi:radical SAM superfamily enzyme YgiQ (UPF0313 family)
MKILFVSPENLYDVGLFYKIINVFAILPSQNFEHLASTTPEDHEITFVNELFHRVRGDEEYDLVGITCYTAQALRAYELADRFRKRGITTIIGGWHASALPQEAKQHADSVVIGEAEQIWPQLLKDHEQGRLQPFYQEKQPLMLDAIPPPKRIKNSFDTRFFDIGVVQASRGCPNKCSFCAGPYTSWGHSFRRRPVDDVVRDIAASKSKYVAFNDPSLTADPRYSKELFRRLKHMDKMFGAEGNINVLANDDEFLKLASEAGCVGWAIGFESISQKTLESVGKRTNTASDYAQAIKKLKDYGMVVKGLFMFGFDTDAPEDFDKTLAAIQEWDLDSAQFSILTPFPGTPIFNKLDEEGRLLTKDWSRYNLKTVVYQPKNMSPQELFNGVQDIGREYNSMYNTVRRITKNLSLDLSKVFVNAEANLFHYYLYHFGYSRTPNT